MKQVRRQVPQVPFKIRFAFTNIFLYFFPILIIRALWTFVLGTAGITLLCAYAGLVVYSTYHDCDPLTTKVAKAKDQLLPLLVTRVLGQFPGMPGLFVAGIFSAALRYIINSYDY